MNQQTPLKHNIEPLLLVDDVCSILRISKPYFRKLVRLGKMPKPSAIGGKQVWHQSTIRSIVEGMVQA